MACLGGRTGGGASLEPREPLEITESLLLCMEWWDRLRLATGLVDLGCRWWLEPISWSALGTETLEFLPREE